MLDAGTPIDLISVQESLKAAEALDQVGGIAYLSQLQDAVPSAANLAYYLAIVREKFILRRAIQDLLRCGRADLRVWGKR